MAEAFTGARALFWIDEIPVAFAAGMSGEEVYDYDPVAVLGLLEVREHVPVAYRTGLSAQAFRLVGSPLKKFGDQSKEIFPKLENALTAGTMTATIIDQITNTVVSQFSEVKASGHTWDVTARGVVAENISFVAIRHKDESSII